CPGGAAGRLAGGPLEYLLDLSGDGGPVVRCGLCDRLRRGVAGTDGLPFFPRPGRGGPLALCPSDDTAPVAGGPAEHGQRHPPKRGRDWGVNYSLRGGGPCAAIRTVAAAVLGRRRAGAELGGPLAALGPAAGFAELCAWEAYRARSLS